MVIVLSLFLGVFGLFYLADKILPPIYPPQIYRAETSPDGTWSVEVWREANPYYPSADGVDVVVVIKNAWGQEVKRETIDNRDRWEDVEDDYPEVSITNSEIKIGSSWSIYIIEKEDVFMGRRQTCPSYVLRFTEECARAHTSQPRQ